MTWLKLYANFQSSATTMVNAQDDNAFNTYQYINTDSDKLYDLEMMRLTCIYNNTHSMCNTSPKAGAYTPL